MNRSYRVASAPGMAYIYGSCIVKKKDVPQHGGLLSGNREVTYAVGKDGRYSLEPSIGWEPKNIALRQAWEAISDQLGIVLSEVQAGKKSPLAYHMVKNQMDPTLLAQYLGIARWKINRHLKPGVFSALSPETLKKYARLFRITVEELRTVPKTLTPPFEGAETDEADPQ